VTTCPQCRRTFDDGVRFCPVDGVLVSAANEDRNLGQVLLGQFEVREVCGRGAMGTVYRAHQRTMDRPVAVKILRRDLLIEPGVVRRFLREARAAAKLAHPNIVTVHLVGETTDGVPFLAMEFVDGVSLEGLLEAEGRQPAARTLALCKQIAIALAEAHQAGIVHRDLKPANILVTSRGRQRDLVKVLDFGIAKIVHSDGSAESQVTRDGMIFGTPHYIAPEQATGSEIDHRADLYSLGVIMFRLATGRLPFEGGAGMQVVLKHLREPPPRPRAIEPAIPVPLEELILTCLAKDPAQRPATAEALVAEIEWIEAALPSLTAAAPPPSGTLLGVGPGAVAASTPGVRARATGALRAPERRRWRRTVVAGAAALAVGAAAGIFAGRARRVEAPRAGVASPLAPAPPRLSAPSLLLEHKVEEGGVTLRAGLVAPPRLGVPASLRILVSAAGGDARVALAAHAPTGRELTLPVTGGDGVYSAALPLDAAGRHRVRLSASVPGRAAPVVLAFDVEVAAPAAAAARPEPRAARPRRDDLPMTVIPADRARAAATPPHVISTPRPDPAPPVPAPVLAPAAPPPAPTTTVVEHPRPISPRPAPPVSHVEEDPGPPPMPRPTDPTTLPPPAPTN
jgi:serine/threonine-protein kinase